jgi:hypothetical protein
LVAGWRRFRSSGLIEFGFATLAIPVIVANQSVALRT